MANPVKPKAVVWTRPGKVTMAHSKISCGVNDAKFLFKNAIYSGLMGKVAAADSLDEKGEGAEFSADGDIAMCVLQVYKFREWACCGKL
jgi:hypothetical protein